MSADNFWGDAAAETTGAFDGGGGSFELIPEGTTVLAAISEIGWTQYEGREYINAQWAVLRPESYKNRRIFQKIQVLESDEKKALRAKRMLAAIDKNASGGKLLAIPGRPTDANLMRHLLNKPMLLKLGVWDQNGKSGNWVQAVAPKTNGPLPDTHVAKPRSREVPPNRDSDAYDAYVDARADDVLYGHQTTAQQNSDADSDSIPF